MIQVSLAELRENLGEYVRRVRRGEDIAVTDEGTVVAQLVAPNSIGATFGTADKAPAKTRREGKPLPVFPPLLKKASVAELLDELRGEH